MRPSCEPLRPSPLRDPPPPVTTLASEEANETLVLLRTVRTCLQGIQPDQESVRPVGGG